MSFASLIVNRIILDAATRRFQAHKTYLIAAAGMRWIVSRTQVTQQNVPKEKRQAAFETIDKRLRQVSHDFSRSETTAMVELAKADCILHVCINL